MRPLRDINDEADLRRLYGRFPTGVTALCAMDEGRPLGMTASAFVAVSLNPPLVSVCVKHGSWTWRRLRLRERIGMSFLGDTHAATARQLAQRADDRFRGLGYEVATGGAVFMNGAAAWLDCAIEREIQAGDHDIVLFRLNRATVADEIMPLIYHASGFHALAPIRPSDHSPVADRSAAHDDQAEARSADAITDQQRVS